MTPDAEVSEVNQIARVSAVASDGCRLFLELPSSGVVTVDSSEPSGLAVGTVLLVRAEDDYIEVVPDYVWPSESGDSDSSWVGVIVLRTPGVTVVDVGTRWHHIPTNGVTYRVGNTVEGRDPEGVTRVLDENPLRGRDVPGIDDALIASFRVESSGEETFDDFGGLDEVKNRARELIELPLLRDAELCEIGARPIKGVLFTGDPGAGKTMLARIIANHAQASFYEISGPAVFSKWYGESEELLRKLFAEAARQERSIIFFDEIDSVAGQRNDESHEASKRVVAQLLTLMDGFKREDNVVVIAASNRPRDIDVALRRPGRFDWEVAFPRPGREDREAILRAASKGLKLREPLQHAEIAAITEGWSAAELAAIWSEAAILAVLDRRAAIRKEDYRGGYDRVAVQRNRTQSEGSRG
jgi:transitional endoplasmic reticulum ATPase